MVKSWADHVFKNIGEARQLYHRLILMVGLPSNVQTYALRQESSSTSAPLVNVNLELSRRMVGLT